MLEVTSDVKTTLDTLNFMAIMISQGRLKIIVKNHFYYHAMIILK